MNDVNYAALNARYRSGGVHFKEGAGGFALVEVENAHGSAQIALQGAQLLSWTPKGAPAVVWLSPAAKYAAGKSVRGGVPVCWPWFGPHPAEAAFPAHGFVRGLPWEPGDVQLRADGATLLTFRLGGDATTQRWWPHPFALEYRLTIGDALELELVTRNTGDAVFTITEALHTYFAVSDVREIRIDGLDGCDYLDKVDDGRRKRQQGPIRFDAETDRIYLDTTADCVIDDPSLRRRIRIAKRGSRSTVVWNPWIDKAARLGDMGDDGYLRMVCVESANAADAAVTVAAGAEHRLWVRYTVEAR